LKQAEAADEDDFCRQQEEKFGDFCRFATTKEEALAGGCPGKRLNPRPNAPDPRHERRLIELRSKLDREAKELTLAQREEVRLGAARDQAESAYKEARKEYDRHAASHNHKMGTLDARARYAKEFGHKCTQLRQARDKQATNEKMLARVKEVKHHVHELLDGRKLALSEHFDRVLKELVGPQAGGRIVIDARGLTPTPDASMGTTGQALRTSATVLGFDIACLIASVAGTGQFPRLLIHDSPREADMEEAMYNRLFLLLRDLESRFHNRAPSFQYIVTTTTPPPRHLPRDPYVRMELDGRTGDGLLLRQRL
jgi:hypothetical protein